MVKLDLKDRKILYQLDLNCRQSLTQIGKKVGLKKDVVSYRIKRMQDDGIITGFWTNIDSYKLGFSVFRYYLVFQSMKSSVRNEIINHFVNYKNTWVVNSVKGTYDLALVLWVKSIPEFYKFWDETNEKYGDYFAEKIFSVYVQAFCYPSTYLIAGEYEKSDRDKYEILGVGDQVQIDDFDYKILNELAENARIPLIELAENLGSSPQMVNYRIKNLITKDVIQAFKLGIHLGKLGFEHFKVDFFLKQPSKKKDLFNYLKYNPYVTFISTSAGYADLEIEFVIESSDKLLDVIEDVKTRFPGVIRKYVYFAALKHYKLRCLPEI